MKLGVTAWLSVLSAVLPTASGQPAQTQHANAATYSVGFVNISYNKIPLQSRARKTFLLFTNLVASRFRMWMKKFHLGTIRIRCGWSEGQIRQFGHPPRMIRTYLHMLHSSVLYHRPWGIGVLSSHIY